MSLSRDLANEFRGVQNTFIYYLAGVNLAIIGFIFTQIKTIHNCIEYYALAIGFLFLIASVIVCALYIHHGMRWYQVVINKNKIIEINSNNKDPEVDEALSEHQNEIDSVGNKMANCFNLTIILLGTGLLMVFVWKIITLFG